MPIVKVLLDDVAVEFPEGTKLYDIAQEANLDITFGCLTGSCGTCKIRVVEGATNLSKVKPTERDYLKNTQAKEDIRLGCQCILNGDCTLDYVDYIK